MIGNDVATLVLARWDCVLDLERASCVLSGQDGVSNFDNVEEDLDADDAMSAGGSVRATVTPAYA